MMEVNSSPISELSTPLLGTTQQEEGVQTKSIPNSEEETETSSQFRFHNPRWLCYQRIVLGLSLPPLYFLAVEMTKEHCYFCHRAIDDSSNTCIVVAAALWGSLMATLYEQCNRNHHCCASVFGGALAASGSLYTMWMLLESIASNDVVFLFALLVGVLGAMPGILLYFVAKIFCSEFSKQTNVGNEATRERVMSADTVTEVEEEMIV
ncbi:unnamed protein product [Cylindrotheca closterium]|uniref:Uncharacterized protein n=1 Tax=Cylindrotheca closterium TaxID=2856 RepID=A0AAD2CDX4_9STRA|nr:unnamed protein product [Cylindrotheca closterium]